MIPKRHIPNLLTASRGLGIVVISVLFWMQPLHFAAWALFVFLLSALTDFYDGFLSRRWKVVSEIGIVFDSLLDKLLILSLFFLLSSFPGMPAALFLILFWREMLVDGMKNFLLSQGKPVSALLWGKIKMVLQVLLVILCLGALVFPDNLSAEILWGVGLLTVAVSWGSAIPYTRSFFALVTQK